MKKIRAIAAVLNLAVLVAAISLPVSSVFAADEGKVSTKLGKPVTDAQRALQAKQWDQALSKLREADAIGDKTAYDQFMINQLYAAAYQGQKKYGEAAAVYEKLIESGRLSDAQKDQYTKLIAQLYLQVRNNAKSTEYLERWLKAHPNDTEMTALLAQSQYQAGQFKRAMDTLTELVKVTERAGARPKEDWLKLMYSIAFKLNDDRKDQGMQAGPPPQGMDSQGMGGENHNDDHRNEPSRMDPVTVDVLEKLVRYYPSPAYWQSLLLSGLKQQRMSDMSRFQLDRLVLSVGIMKSSNDFIELAQLSRNFGLPGEALRVLEKGYASGAIGSGPGKDREDRLKAAVVKEVEKQKAELSGLEARARSAPTGQEDAMLGEIYLSYGQYPQAIEALERGIKKGNFKDPDRTRFALGIAQYNSNRADKARTVFRQIPKSSEYGRIAELWALHAGG
jgi:tetratricopeptide (TPR) repeat protein